MRVVGMSFSAHSQESREHEPVLMMCINEFTVTRVLCDLDECTCCCAQGHDDDV